jgi:hypothetical protein
MRRRAFVASTMMACMVALGACGSSLASGSIDSTASRWLESEVAAARTAAASGNNAGALDELQRVITDAQTFRDRRMIGADRASEIQHDAQRVIFAINATASTTSVPTTAPRPVTPAPSPPQHHKGAHGGKGD